MASSGFTVAVSVSLSPSVSTSSDLLRVIEVTAITFASTVTLQVADCSPAFAVMTADPAFRAVTLPFSTVATVASEVLHVTDLFVASSGFTVAVSVSLSPSVNTSSGLLRVIEVTAITFAFTVTLHVAVLSPAFAVMTADPAFSAVTLPFSTVATVASDVLQVTVLSVASSGFTVAVSISLPPSVKIRSVLFKETDVTATVLG